MKVRIYKPSKNAMQSGRGGRAGQWVLEYETVTPRRPEPLMGWASSSDTLNQVVLKFPTKEEALAFAARHGWQAVVAPGHDRRVVPRNYGDNFRYIPPAPRDKAGK